MTKNAQGLSFKMIDKAIDGIALRGAKLKDEIGRVAAMIVIHAVKFGDITAADKLCKVAASVGHRNDSLAKWFQETGCARIKSTEIEGKTVKSFGVDNAKRDALAEEIATDGEAKVAGRLRSIDWNAAKAKSDTYEGFDLESKIRGLVKTAKKHAEIHGNNPKTVIDPDMLRALEGLYLKPVADAGMIGPEVKVEGWDVVEGGAVN